MPYNSTPLKDPEILSLRDKALKGDVESQYLLGLYHLIGKHCNKNKSMAFQWIEGAAQNGHPEARVKEALLLSLWSKSGREHSYRIKIFNGSWSYRNNEALQELKNHFPNVD